MSSVFQKLQHSDSLTVGKILKKWIDFLRKRHICKITVFFLLVLLCKISKKNLRCFRDKSFTYKSLLKITIKLIRCIDKKCDIEEIQIQNITFRFMIYVQIFPGEYGYVTIICKRSVVTCSRFSADGIVLLKWCYAWYHNQIENGAEGD